MIHAWVSHLTLGRTGDFMMSMLTIVVVVMTVSAQLHSLCAIFMYDIYQAYINPFPEQCPAETTSPNNHRTLYLCYNKRNVYIRHIVIILLCILPFPVTWVFMLINTTFVYKIFFVTIVLGAAVVPVWL